MGNAYFNTKNFEYYLCISRFFLLSVDRILVLKKRSLGNKPNRNFKMVYNFYWYALWLFICQIITNGLQEYEKANKTDISIWINKSLKTEGPTDLHTQKLTDKQTDRLTDWKSKRPWDWQTNKPIDQYFDRLRD